MAEKNDLNVTDASNTARFPEGMARAAVNNAARALEGIEARDYKDNNGSLVTAGSSTVYTVTLNSQHSAWFDGLTFRARMDETCGATPTINPTGSTALGAKSLYWNNGTAVASGELVENGVYDFVYKSGTDRVYVLSTTGPGASTATTLTAGNGLTGGGDLSTNRSFAVGAGEGIAVAADAVSIDPTFFPGFITGLVPSNAADTDHDITISAGVAVDATGGVLMKSSAITKQIDAAWSVGTNAGGMDTSSVGNSTWYAIWLIKRSDTAVVDALFSASFSSPTMPANYDYKRLIGAVLTDGSANIINFRTIEMGGGAIYTDWLVPRLDVNASRTTTRTSYTLSVPPKVVLAHVANGAQDTNSAKQWLSNPNLTDTAPDAPGTATGLHNDHNGASAAGDASILWIVTNSSGQIALDSSAASGSWYVRTFGWQDFRRP